MGQGLNEHRVFRQTTQAVITPERLLQRLDQMNFTQREHGNMSAMLGDQIPGLLVDE